MTKRLVIVESPAKAKTINKILGADYIVKASMGHVRDLPNKELAVDVEKNFEPKYVKIKGREKVIKELKEAAAKVDEVMLAPDPDREGEAIAWHLLQTLKSKALPVDRFHRVTYNEITAPAIRKAFDNPKQLDMHKVDSQQARRVLDRIVGYQVSPILWRRIRGASSAGRVQSVALRLVCDREKEILGFVPEAYWILGANVHKQQPPKDVFGIRLSKVDGEKADIRDEALATEISTELERATLKVVDIQERMISKRPQPSYITSTLQQAGSRFFGFTPKRTMQIAQKLYEGIDTGDGVAGLITYMRTDSPAISPVAQQECRQWVGGKFGAEYLPDHPPTYKSRAGAQEAHEAIRPTDVTRTPEMMSRFLGPDEAKLYRIIWERFVASQMAPARIAQKLVEIDAAITGEAKHAYLFRASASEVVFPGYMKITGMEQKKKAQGNDDGEGGAPEDQDADSLPPLTVGEPLDVVEWLSDRKETTPPPRYTESSLIKALEENGVGRPSTFAQTISTILDREYVEKDKRALKPTDTGMKTCDFLVQHLPDLFDIGFTAQMEATLDDVESGKVLWTDMMRDFYTSFQGWLEKAKAPPADVGHVNRLLELLGQVKAWAPAVKRGKRTYDDEKFVDSVRDQLAAGEKVVTDRQLEALISMAGRYHEQLPEAESMIRDMGYGAMFDAMKEKAQPPREETPRKLALLETVTF
ncbi:MAG: type I DNA topoisomerase, partial [Kiritimatiellae bacterium]|nr:type I DNA topoisomerase [Kiritimatiellia bacterium]